METNCYQLTLPAVDRRKQVCDTEGSDVPNNRENKKMMWRKKIPEKTLRLLYAHSGNQCAYPGCCAPIFEDDGLLTAECCHIKAFSIGGPRYDA